MTEQQEETADHFHRLWYEELGMCGCGTPGAAYQLIRDILALVPFYEDSRWQQVEAMCGGPGAAHVVVSVLDHADLLGHGTSLLGSWLTPKGERVLKLMREVSFEEINAEDAGLPHNGQPCTPQCWA